MKMNSQSRSFARQVQVDLLALDDTDLFHIVHEWVEEGDASGLSITPEDVHTALGYTHVLTEAQTLPHPFYTNYEENSQWIAPPPHELRALISAMDVNEFTHHVISVAFQSLHTTYPEWYEGVTFNAHLANYLRMRKKSSLP
jgi:predicted phosphoadenosine phosphosulfate sulfurtransferase